VADLGLLLLQIALNVLLPAWVVRRDLRRLPPEQLARSWNDASLWAAVVLFGPLCLPVHAVKSRRSMAGLGLGLLWLAGAVLATTLASWAAALGLGLDG
jgi:hypothetical protein